MLGEQYLPRFALEYITLDYVALCPWAILCKIFDLLNNSWRSIAHPSKHLVAVAEEGYA